MTNFDCKRFVPEICKGDCCGVVPIPQGVFLSNKAKEQREVCFEFTQEEDLAIVPITKTGNCVYLTSEYQCAIYDDRPSVCKNFGLDNRSCNRCPYMYKDGSQRRREKSRKIKKEVESFKETKMII